MKKRLKATYTERLTIRISKELLEKVKNKAVEHEMSESAWVRMILKKEIKKEK